MVFCLKIELEKKPGDLLVSVLGLFKPLNVNTSRAFERGSKYKSWKLGHDNGLEIKVYLSREYAGNVSAEIIN